MNKPTDLQGLVLDPITGDQRYIGHSEPRHSARRLLQGQGTYIDDLQFPRMGHVVYWRSPVAHMKIGQIHTDRARKMPGVIAIVDGHIRYLDRLVRACIWVDIGECTARERV